jgi:rRNA biogenesis protein RRP5
MTRRCVGTHVHSILGFNALDGMANVSLQQSVLSEQVLRHEELKPGMLLKVHAPSLRRRSSVTTRRCPQGDISAVKDFGLLVQISSRVRALCPLMHLADGPVKDPAAKFKTGKLRTRAPARPLPAALPHTCACLLLQASRWRCVC